MASREASINEEIKASLNFIEHVEFDENGKEVTRTKISELAGMVMEKKSKEQADYRNALVLYEKAKELAQLKGRRREAYTVLSDAARLFFIEPLSTEIKTLLSASPV